jgi:predicted dienelactone hydrolase
MLKLLSATLSAALIAAAVPSSANAQAAKVGMQTIDHVDTARQRTLTMSVWYPVSADAKTEAFRARPLFESLDLAVDAAPEPNLGKRPLIVLSHGNWGTRHSQGWLAVELVKAGYLVMTTTHPGTSADDQTQAGRIRYWDRARDVSVSLDRLLASNWRASIDEQRIGFGGHSFGGNTAVHLAGGRFDPARQLVACQANPTADLYCSNTAKEGINVDISGAGESMLDRRFKAFYAMASGPAAGFDPESLRSIRSPMLFDTAMQDTILEPKGNSRAFARAIPGATEIERNTDHFAYIPVCRPIIGATLGASLGIPVCDGPSTGPRKAVHQSVQADVIGFFNRTLGK